jgi:hypothetical protein
VTRENACANAEIVRTIEQHGFSYDYRYSAKSGIAIAHFQIRTCLVVVSRV